ncbi:hypothetical protein N5912_09965 [Arcobacter lacus]|uniref:hypothetical protein n=1 Tax=Arcobacter lacus TaxID=1912876 RepID=UPI0021BBA65C|nr:hypothetical protein [Arcobacter lacus]MCT7912153.1 hypothetical protein [Arcobacter lacus]
MHFYDPKQGLIRLKRVEGIEGILYVFTLNLINYFFLYFILIGFNTDVSFLDFYEKVSIFGILQLESFKHLLLILMSNALTLIIIKDKLEK